MGFDLAYQLMCAVPASFREQKKITIPNREVLAARTFQILQFVARLVAQLRDRDAVVDQQFGLLRHPFERNFREQQRDHHRQRCEYAGRSEEHPYELQSLMRISYAVSCLKKTN